MQKYMNLEKISDKQKWDEFVASAPHSHPFQLSSWAEIKRENGWKSARFGVVNDGKIVAGGQMLFLRAPMTGYALAYMPRGPLSTSDDIDTDELLAAFGEKARNMGATTLKIEPSFQSYSPSRPWRKAKQQILHPHTSVITLGTEDAEDILKSLKRGARRDIRKSQRQGLDTSVATDDDLDEVLAVYGETAKRAGFNLYSKEYYRKVFTELGSNNTIWIAREKGAIVAFLWAAHAGDTAIYLYGGSNSRGRDTYANYTLQWAAIEHYNRIGVSLYDLNGHVNDGVSSFKRKFTDNTIDYCGSFDLPLRKFRYHIWESLLPKLKPLLHFIKSRLP